MALLLFRQKRGFRAFLKEGVEMVGRGRPMLFGIVWFQPHWSNEWMPRAVGDFRRGETLSNRGASTEADRTGV